ncbi:MAG: 4-hydroxy-3-methylbut-2-enyl diphosphate reductase [Verrucomicrobiae bacterium]|nr:4-hydroxy-3-methylbut-2-enyl diphosphate reductase [Verrucomicrobiae bacterium]MCP5541330.1 4-hydroxy-3-methylbut-2-enyl diphosphate reductase [Akkermansiaceae bacterium]
MKIQIATHYGMCFGVRDAVRHTQDLAESRPVTVLGELVHNPVVRTKLDALGVARGDLNDPGSARTETVVITAHGAADSARRDWAAAGHRVFDTTCPLVRKAHRSLECLVLAGYHPVVIGQREHVEVRGLTADFPGAIVVLEAADLVEIPAGLARIGVVSQTTQPIAKVEALIDSIRREHPASEVRFIDTVCQPTKDRQNALDALCRDNDTIVVVGGRNSNNTAQLAETAAARGCRVFPVEGAADLRPEWFRDSRRVGITAGTSTLEETVQAVAERLRQMAMNRGTFAKAV